jgi:hypothetical protein
LEGDEIWEAREVMRVLQAYVVARQEASRVRTRVLGLRVALKKELEV